MNTKTFMGLLAANTIAGGAISSALCTAAGWAGTATLSANYPGLVGYNIDDAVKIGAIGGAVVGAAAGALSTCGYNLFSNNKEGQSLIQTVALYSVDIMLSALAGYGILKSAGVDLEMDINDTMLAFLTGGAETAIPATIGIACIALPCILACTPKEEESDNMLASLVANRHTPHSTV